ncbi:MAG TPA: TldD/PmbA family protein [Clostridiales bacterium]|jgi:PmbA protein|nr:TldD/PmbA family protein [Clostridiales bacterium]
MDNRQVAEYLIQTMKEKGADMGECRVSSNVKTEVYYESGKISMVRSVLGASVGVKVLKDMKKGAIQINSAEKEALDKAVDDALAAAAFAKPDEAEGISDEVVTASFEKGPKVPDRDALYSAMRTFVDDVKRDYPKISFDSISTEHVASEVVYQNTNGVCLTNSNGVNGYGAMFMAVENGKSSSFNYFGETFTDFQQPLIERGLARTILSETERQIETRNLEGKFEGDILIPPNCLDVFLYYLQQNFLSDMVHIEGTSLWKDALNTVVAVPELTFACRPRDERLAANQPFTGDGYIAQNMNIIENGVLKNFTLSRYGAAKTGKARSANTGGYYVVEPGTKTKEELLASIPKGLLLNRFSGGSPGTNGDFTGVAKNSFLIENGKVTDAVSEVMVSGNLATMLKNITGISVETINDGNSILPWIKVSGIVISGK